MGENLVKAGAKSGIIVSQVSTEDFLRRIDSAALDGGMIATAKGRNFQIVIRNSNMIFTTVRGSVANHSGGGCHIKYKFFDQFDMARMALIPALLIVVPSMVIMNPDKTSRGLLQDLFLILPPLLVFYGYFVLKVQVAGGRSVNESNQQRILECLRQASGTRETEA